MKRFFHPLERIPVDLKLPQRFTYPFQYVPHPIAIIATKQLQKKLDAGIGVAHNFGLGEKDNQDKEAVAKMFGVLVVQKETGELGYLAAFSGQLGTQNHVDGFVPPIYDVLDENGFLFKSRKDFEAINQQIENLIKHSNYQENIKKKKALVKEFNAVLKEAKTALNINKKKRRILRLKAQEELKPAELEAYNHSLNQESLQQKGQCKRLEKSWKKRIADISTEIEIHQEKIEVLQVERQQLSAYLQQQLFQNYHFLNQKKESKNLLDIFKDNLEQTPISGTGECAAPKLFQYAFQHDLKPIALAEFWWGKSPKAQVRKHKTYYPACKSKCKPILTHMLEGIPMDENPVQSFFRPEKNIQILFEDEHLLVISKPEGLLSVPGKAVKDSVYSRIREKYPRAKGPIIVHRLDMATSGLMLIPKSTISYQALQQQFIKKTIQKTYAALLDGVPEQVEVHIDLPLRVDLDNRPRQLVCYDYGKAARTKWEIVKVKNQQALVHFYPITGRTHQLRVHAAHQDGLNTPILGDVLYGKAHDRLHLHAQKIRFEHPSTKETMQFEDLAEFYF